MPLGLLLILIGVVVSALVSTVLGVVLVIAGLIVLFVPAPRGP